MTYRVRIYSWKNPSLAYTVQTLWVNIDVPSDDPELQEKIIFGLEYNKIHIMFNINDEKQGKCKVHEIIPFPEYPGYTEAGSILIDLNNSLEAYSIEPDIKMHINAYTDIMDHLNAARSLLYEYCDGKSFKEIIPITHMLTDIKGKLTKMFKEHNKSHYNLIIKRYSDIVEQKVMEGLQNGTITQVDDNVYKTTHYGDEFTKGPDGLWKQTSFGM